MSVRTQWLDWIRPMTQKSRLTLKKNRILANSRGWCSYQYHHVHTFDLACSASSSLPLIVAEFNERYRRMEGRGTKNAIMAFFTFLTLPMVSPLPNLIVFTFLYGLLPIYSSRKWKLWEAKAEPLPNNMVPMQRFTFCCLWAPHTITPP